MKRLILFLIGVSVATAQTFYDPDAETLPPAGWVPGTNLGVPGGVAQYGDAGGGANARTTASAINVRVSIPSSSYIAAGVDTITTGTATGGSTTVTLADASSYAAGHGIRFGATTLISIVVTAEATSSGNVTVTLNGVAKTVAVLAGDSISDVAGKIHNASYTNATPRLKTATGCSFATSDTGAGVSASFSGGSTGVTATITPAGSAYAGTQTVISRITAAATSAGNITVTLNGTAHLVAVAEGDTTAQVKAKVLAASYSNATVATYDATAVSFVTTDRGSSLNCSINGGSTGVTGTAVVSFSPYVRRVVSVAGNVLTLDSAITTGFTAQVVRHEDRTAIQAAITASTSGQVVYLPAGTYPTYSQINLASNRTIRGASMGTAIIQCYDNGPTGSSGIYGGAGNFYDSAAPSITITDSPVADAESFTVSSTTGLAVGQLIKIRLTNAPMDADRPIFSTNALTYVQNFTTRITGISGTTVTVFPKLPYALPVGRLPDIRYVSNPLTGAGVESLTIDMSTASGDAGINLNTPYRCWVLGVKVGGFSARGIQFEDPILCEIRESWIEAYSTGPNKSGILMNNAACWNLIEDNVVLDVFPAIQLFGSSTGNAISYNLALADAGTLMIHNAHPIFNIIEGNVASNVQFDGYYGSTSDNTIHRNWFRGLKRNGSSVFVNSFNRAVRYTNLLGNVFGDSTRVAATYSFGNPNIGNGSTEGQAQPSLGDWWLNWDVVNERPQLWPGTLTLKTGSASGELTFETGLGAQVAAHKVGDGYTINVAWTAGGQSPNIVVGTVTGDVMSFTESSLALPAQGSTFIANPGATGFQELDLDVVATTDKRVNYLVGAGQPSGEELPEGYTLRKSYLYGETKPAFFGSLAWPIEASSGQPSGGYGIIPAGARYVAAEGEVEPEPPVGGSATATTANIGTLNIAP